MAIGLLKERRTVLIAVAVTGEIDVRDAEHTKRYGEQAYGESE